MAARFDHLVVAVDDLDEAAARWGAAGLPAVRGGAHPVGTENALVRGPGAAYVELIAAGRDESNPWLDRVRGARGPLSWAVAVDDMETAREALRAAGLDPAPAVPGSRRTPDGDVVEWVVCDVNDGPYGWALPFLIQWTTPMPPGPADGPVVEWVGLAPPDPEPVADLLLALGFHPSEHWPRRVLHDATGLQVTLSPVGDPVGLDRTAWYMSWPDEEDASAGEPAASLSFGVPAAGPTDLVVDGVGVSTRADRRRFAASALLPAVDEAFDRLRGDLADWPNPHPGGRAAVEDEYSRREHPERYRLLAARADAWVEAVVSAGLGTAHRVDPNERQWVEPSALPSARTTVLRGRPGTLPVTVSLLEDETFVRVGVGEPVEALDLQPDCGCDACDTGSADLLDAVDSVFVLALSGGVLAVRNGDLVVRRSLDGWSSTGVEDAEVWLAEAAEGRRTQGVVAGEPWLS
ncbi:hypothetical protein F4692_002920 [Nocardioides cavernae]|uniref:VOC domain-containing protein n=1 Tax=Nocardioides cavernae TaxID=1921566 RepID=A0A7Y9H4I1_9ACTN|nr:DUF6226 family protein [Nocardioides cavernae]NYE37787.1 hypothetical protein [Nocardioides cavernae]